MRNALVLLVAGCSAQNVIEARKLPAAERDDAAAVALANNAFAVDLYKQLAMSDGNLFASPFSIATAFAMLDAGAAGMTDAELRAAFHVALPPERQHPAYGALLASLDTGRSFGNYTLATADRLFGQQGFGFEQSFLTITKDAYGAALVPVDFAGDPDGARDTVNRWVASQTDNRIPELFAPGSLDSSTRLAIANAILFAGSWDRQFDSSHTQPGAFHLADGTTVMPQMMSKQDALAFAPIHGGRLAVMPFAGKDLSFVVLLPNTAEGLPALEAGLDAANLEQAIASASVIGEAAEVRFPKLAITSAFDLQTTLRALGVTSVFDPARADLSGIDGATDLVVDSAVHKAVLTVDEHGAEAAAATGIGVTTTSLPSPFEVDHPFAFLIFDHVTGSILFMGRVQDPTT